MSQPGGVAFPHLPAETWELFLDDRLPAEANERVERHLAECAACRAALERTDPSRLFRRLSGLAVQPQVWDGFWDGIARQLPERTPAAARRRRPHAVRWALAGGLAAAVVLAVSLPLVVRGPAPGGLVARGTEAEDAPCPTAVAHLHLSREECAALYARPIAETGSIEVILEPRLDLRGL